jgi:DNA-directed RNA polymerase III subunit RPC1
MCDGDLRIDLPPPAIVKPCRLWTGKEVIGLLLRPNTDSKIFVNLSKANKSNTTGESMCPQDGFVIFRNSIHICGHLDKSIVGSGAKNTIFYVGIRVLFFYFILLMYA